ncbi:MAG TPA: hypothetical protein VK461_04005 [Acidimicrobiales bacterium]|nr:hypothetical protein [Acidimicrobiales bacterium]
MALFGRHKKQADAPAQTEVIAALTPAAASLGLHPADSTVIDRDLLDPIKEASRVLHGFTYRWTSTVDVGIPNMFFNDVFTGTIDGRAVTAANVRTPMEAMSLEYMAKVHSTSLVIVELSTLVPYSLEPRLKHHAFHGVEIPTGDAEFDAAFRVVGLIALGESPFSSPEVRQRISAHHDWIFSFNDAVLACIGLPAFTEADELTTRVQEVLGVVKAFPASVAPSVVDHSVDDLLVRIDKLDTLEDGIAFLQSLSDADRARLAASPTPLAKFADVRTPDEAGERFMSLDVNERLQVLAMFEKSK